MAGKLVTIDQLDPMVDVNDTEEVAIVQTVDEDTRTLRASPLLKRAYDPRSTGAVGNANAVAYRAILSDDIGDRTFTYLAGYDERGIPIVSPVRAAESQAIADGFIVNGGSFGDEVKVVNTGAIADDFSQYSRFDVISVGLNGEMEVLTQQAKDERENEFLQIAAVIRDASVNGLMMMNITIAGIERLPDPPVTVYMPYMFEPQLDDPVPIGVVRCNSQTFADITALYINAEDLNGLDRSDLLTGAEIGDLISLVSTGANVGVQWNFEITGDSDKVDGRYAFGISPLSQLGDLDLTQRVNVVLTH